MENVILAIHLILALMLIGVVLLQRSEGGALGMGGGGNVLSGRGAATALSKVTWGLAAAFIATSLLLTIFASQDARQGDDVLDRLRLDDVAPALDGGPVDEPAAPIAPVSPILPPIEPAPVEN